MKHAIPSKRHALSTIKLDPQAKTPLYQQIYQGLREAILRGQLTAGLSLPSSRNMASQLAVSRNTVRNALDQLLAEGYLEAKVGSGTYVTSQLPDELLAGWRLPAVPTKSSAPRRLSPYGEAMSQLGRTFGSPTRTNHPLFAVGQPDMSLFPQEAWTRLTTRWQRNITRQDLARPQSYLGYRPLRAAIASYLRTTRAVQCDPEQVIIVPGTQRALYITAQLLLARGEKAWVENPGYLGARGAILCAGGELAPVPVDEQGLNVAAGKQIAPDAPLAVVTPSHQYPTGHVLSLARRLQLLQWAAQEGRWIVEDDYDSAYQYDGAPLPALQGLDQHQRVIYLGTLSKILFPTLRLAYLVVPPDLIPAYLGALAPTGSYPPLLGQAVLASFIEEGYFAHHLRRMRKQYAARRDLLVNLLKQHLNGRVTLGPTDCGMHVVGWLNDAVSDTAVAQRAAQDGYIIQTVSQTTIAQANAPVRNGLLLSFTSASPQEMGEGVRYLEQIISEAGKG